MRLTVLDSGTELGTTDQCLLEREEESNNISGAEKGRVGPRSMQLPLERNWISREIHLRLGHSTAPSNYQYVLPCE
jgi:hypothetical protein